MKNFSSRYFLFFLVLCTTTFLTSCNGNRENISGKQADIDVSSSLTNRFAEYDEFSVCSDTAKQSCENNSEGGECIEKGIDQCMTEAAAFTGDRSVIKCEDFVSLENKNNCLKRETINQARSEGNIELCDRLSTGDSDDCRQEILLFEAMETGDLSICESEEEFKKVSCTNNILMNQAMREGDISFCEKMISYAGIEDNYEKKMCQEQIEMLGGNSSFLED